MRGVMVIVAALAVTGCYPVKEKPPALSAKADAALPAGFPQADLSARAAECVVYLGLSEQAKATPGGHDAPIMQQSASQWRAALQFDAGMSEAEAQQLIASSVNPVMATPAAQRDAASAWCVENTPSAEPKN
jgi:hypothetical protein